MTQTLHKFPVKIGKMINLIWFCTRVDTFCAGLYSRVLTFTYNRNFADE